MYQIEKALEIALKAHNDQKDRYGRPYILHPLRIMMKMEKDIYKTVAILHDVVEDSDITLNELKDEGFSNNIIEAVACLTKRKGENYFDYIHRVMSNPVAIEVKLADLEDNMDITRIDEIKEKDIERLNRYLKAWKMLKKTINEK